jgi:hypothetical protein
MPHQTVYKNPPSLGLPSNFRYHTESILNFYSIPIHCKFISIYKHMPLAFQSSPAILIRHIYSWSQKVAHSVFAISEPRTPPAASCPVSYYYLVSSTPQLTEHSSLWPFRLRPFNMVQQEYHDIDHNDQTYESIDQWSCIHCFKPVSSSRPPNFNAENCSCVEVRIHANGGGEHFSQPMIREQPMYTYDTTTHYHTQRPQSYASSSLSGPCPEGPEREDPNMHISNAYLPLGPDTGLNETQHQRTASFHSEMSYPMQRFLGDLGYFQPYETEHVPTNGPFLSQDLYIQSSKKVNKGTKRSKQSYMSVQSSGSAEASFVSWGLDPLTAAGAWAGEAGKERPGEGYAMVLSGLTEFHMNDNMN